jgi:4-phytase / acid phosphatase
MKRTSASLLLISLAALPVALHAQAAKPELKYVVIVSRHGVRSPTWDAERLHQYSSQPWPDWRVAPGELTPRGFQLIKLMGGYYREWLSSEHLLADKSCLDAKRIYIWADTDQRTLETGRAFAESLLPGCGIMVHSEQGGRTDPIFSGVGTADPEQSFRAIQARLGADPRKLVTEHRGALDALEFILTEGKTAPKMLEPPSEVGVTRSAKAVELTGPFNVGSTLSENLLLEYTNGFQGADLGWGRLTRQKLQQALELHAVYTDLMRRTPYLATVRSSNLLAHVLRSMEQAVSGTPMSGAIGQPGDKLLVLSGHDTNLSNIAGMLGLTWTLPGYQPDDTPPGGALIFSLWRAPSSGGDGGAYFIKARYVAQTLDQMRDAAPLSLATPPPSQTVSLHDCKATESAVGCPWRIAESEIQKTIDAKFTTIGPNAH